MKKALAIISILAVACIAQPIPDYRSQVSVQPNLQLTANVNDSASGNVIDKLNLFQARNNLNYLLNQIESHYNDRMNYEFHFGGGVFRNHITAHSNETYFFAVKANIMNPKLPQPGHLHAMIHQAENYNLFNLARVDTSILSQLHKYDQSILAYESKIIRRASLLVILPFVRTDITSNYSPSYSGYSYNFGNTILAIGIDIKDIATISMGSSIHKDIYAGISLDLSTPAYYYAQSFLDMFSQFVRSPGARGYYPVSY